MGINPRHDVTLDVELLAGDNEAGVGNAFQGSQNGKTTGSDAIEACALDEARTQCIVGTDELQRTWHFIRHDVLQHVS